MWHRRVRWLSVTTSIIAWNDFVSLLPVIYLNTKKCLAINNKQSRSLELKDVTLKLTEIVRIAPEVVLHFGISAMGIRLSSKEVILERLLRIEDNSLTWEALNGWLIVYWNLGHSTFRIGFVFVWMFIFSQNTVVFNAVWAEIYGRVRLRGEVCVACSICGEAR